MSGRLRALGAIAVAAASVRGAPLAAQSVSDIGARIAPQFHQYHIASPSNITISELAVPLFVLVPITPSFTVDLGTSYARARVSQTADGKTVRSAIDGLTDTQLRGTYVFGNDFVVLAGGVNLPTGRSTVATDQRIAAGLIGSDFLGFPVSNMGTGFGGTGGLAVAHPVGDWNMGGALAMRRSAAYDPFDAAGGVTLRYQPGNEYRARAGVDRAVGTGRVTMGLTFSTFGNDNLAGSLYNTGNRWLTQTSYNNTIAGGQLAVDAWNLFRTRGTLADSSLLGHEDITAASVAYGVAMGDMTIEPNLEARTWLQEGVRTSMLATPGLRAQLEVAGFTVMPNVGYTLGRLAAQDANGANTSARLTGWHATLAVRLR